MAQADAAKMATLSEDDRISDEQASKIIEEFESESPTRTISGPWRWIVGSIAAGLALYSLYWTQYSITTQVYRAAFLMVVLVLTFLLYPVRGRRGWIEFLATLGGGVVLFALYWSALNAAGQQRLFADLSTGAALIQTGVVVVGLLLYGLFARARRQDVPWYDLGIIALSVVSLGFLILNFQAALQRITNPTPIEVLMGIITITLALEATRRTTGWVLPAVALGFLVYAYFGPNVPEPFDHRGYGVQRIVGQNFLTLEGIFGVPLDVAATFIILFTIYGAVLEYSGAGKFFLDWSFAAFGRSRSAAGPGRTATAAGFLLGTVSGSGVATTVTLGSLAWPMLKRGGYNREVAGGILAAAGIGALLSPPTLGAAAFLIAEYLEVSYLDVLVMALIPTVLYYLSAFLMIEADSRRMKAHAVDVAVPDFWDLTRKYGYHFSSLFAVAIFMAMGMTPFMAVFWSIVIAFLLSFLRPETRLTSLGALAVGGVVGVVLLFSGIVNWSQSAFWGLMAATALVALVQVARTFRLPLRVPFLSYGGPEDTRLLAALESGGKGALSVGATTATAGVIVSIVTLTGLGLKISGIIVGLSGGIPFLTVLYAALAVWVLGLAVPVTASYIIAAVMIVPALTQVGVVPAAAHMFIFYYSVLADVSPPTALSPFAAAAITGGNPFRTMMLTWKYCLPAFLVPFMFTLSVEGSSLLLVGQEGKIFTAEPAVAIWTFLTSGVAVGALAVALGGYFVRHAAMAERVLFGFGGLALMYASQTTDLVGGALVVAGAALHLVRIRRSAATMESERLAAA